MKLRNKIHFIGIGGVGMSGLARIYLSKGYSISGSDVAENKNTKFLSNAGASIFIGHSSKNLPTNTSKVVVSSAISSNNPELVLARKLNIPIFHRSDLLAELFLDSENSVAVAGSHGKTTVSSIITTILTAARMNPTCVVGGHVDAINGNACAGNSDLFIAEADESDATFLKYFSKYAIITNVDNDHMDHYSDISSLVKAFELFVSHVDHKGTIYVCSDDAISRNLCVPSELRTISYGVDNPADIMAKNITYLPYGSEFELTIGGISKGNIKLSIPGKHNILNSLPAIALGLDLGLDIETIKTGLEIFKGAGRRFEIKGTFEGITVIDDYGHHPNEIKATLDAARSLDAKRVVVVFQPHRYSRTLYLSQEFGRCFADCDKLFITDIYAASEKPIPGVTSKVILDHMPVSQRRKVKMVKNVDDVELHLLNFVEPGDVVFTMGAGNVTTLGASFIERMKQTHELNFAQLPIEAAG